MRWLPKLLLWGMLVFSCLGTVGMFLRSESNIPDVNFQSMIQQQLAVETAIGFAREWMRWESSETPEQRMMRLKPYVSTEAINRVAILSVEKKTERQEVVSTDLAGITGGAEGYYLIRIRVWAKQIDQTQWEIEVPVWAHAEKGAAVTDMPRILISAEPVAVPDKLSQLPNTPATVKQRMRPAIESFLKAVSESNSAGSLLNYTTANAQITPLAGKMQFISLDHLEAAGAGPYTVTAAFTLQEPSSGFRIPQNWTLVVVEENQKFFVDAVL